MRIVLSTALIFVTLFAVPILVYGFFSSVAGMQIPGGDAVTFLVGVAVSKLGTAIAFVGLWLLARADGRLGSYVLLWWVMFVLGEIGQAIGPDYSWPEAMAGILSETIYLPLSGLFLHWLLPD